MKNLNIEAILSSALKGSSNLLLKVLPGWSPLVNISSWASTHNKFLRDEDSIVMADYYNGSENDIINILRELKYLANQGHNFHGNYLIKRLDFLASEGLNFTDNIHIQEYRKLSEQEINNILLGNKPKKVRKPINKRDSKGRFASKIVKGSKTKKK